MTFRVVLSLIVCLSFGHWIREELHPLFFFG